MVSKCEALLRQELANVTAAAQIGLSEAAAAELAIRQERQEQEQEWASERAHLESEIASTRESVAEAEEHAEEAQELRAECVALRRRVQVMLQEQEDNGIRIDAVHKYLAE